MTPTWVGLEKIHPATTLAVILPKVQGETGFRKKCRKTVEKLGSAQKHHNAMPKWGRGGLTSPQYPSQRQTTYQYGSIALKGSVCGVSEGNSQFIALVKYKGWVDL